MAKEKLGVISSYQELCGNAAYTKALVRGLQKHYNVHVISLNVGLLRSGAFKEAKIHIQKVCEEAQKCDVVNIQFEAGLLGWTPNTVYSRFATIAKSCKKLLVTMHRYTARERYPSIKQAVMGLLEGNVRKVFKKFKYSYTNNRWMKVYNRIANYCKKINASILVHTQRDRDLLKTINPKVFDHPICYFDQAYIKSEKEKVSRVDFCKRYALLNDKIYIGIFGFIDTYKGHETIIKAMKYLPDNYQLLIFGSQHPHSINYEETVAPYIDHLMNLITKDGLADKVRFMGTLNDDDFLQALMCSDFNVLPYLEVNQGGSAIAALSLDAGNKTIFSQNRAFLELARYAPDGFKMFTIGNHFELAHAVLSYNSSDYKNKLELYQKKYNLESSCKLYKDLLSNSETKM